MARVEIISASAGTGKTTRLAKVIADAVSEGHARPEAILATTFTVRAAAELSERAREHLLQRGHVESAQRLAAAKIGTVNAVCDALVPEFAFENGLSPRLRVLNERQAGEILREARAHAVARDRVERLEALTSRFKEIDLWTLRVDRLDWQRRVEDILTLARANDLGDDDLASFAQRSWMALEPLLGTPTEPAEALDSDLDSALLEFQEHLDQELDSTKKTDQARALVERCQRVGAARLRWSDWLGLARLDVGKKSNALAERVRLAAGRHDAHPRLHADLRGTIEQVFEIARLTLRAYQDHKRRLGVVDFVDQELYALHMLRRDTVRERLAEDLDLVLVDEFQDTSPIQLAIFLRLASIAPRSVWVGDPKQAIYGFRGADPALMDAAIQQLLSESPAKTLRTSYRARPRLVKVTSELFAAAFDELGFRREMVEVEPGRLDDRDDLGPAIERWILESNGGQVNAESDAAALASGVKSVLDDPAVRVVDRATGAARRPRPGDVAVLCPQHRHCQRLAAQLERLGLRAVLARPGLFSELEGLLVLRALRLWLDPRDSLARAEIARWLHFPETGDDWLKQVIEDRRNEREPFAAVPEVVALERARVDIHGNAGVLELFDRAIGAMGLREACLRLGDADARLGNLDALRSLAANYVDLCRTESAPSTLAGLVSHFEHLAADAADEQAAHERPDAVVLSTWHGAKGLEWPITVVADLSTLPRHRALDVHLVRDTGTIDLDDPLASRWIRYWPDPYAPKSTGAPFYDRLQGHSATQVSLQQQQRETLRLLYVAWTRSRDRLVLAARSGGLRNQRFATLCARGECLLREPGDDGQVTWPGQDGPIVVRRLRPAPEGTRSPIPASAPLPRGPRRHAPAFVSPSSLEGAGRVGTPESLGDRLPLRATDEQMEAVGHAVHAFLAGDRPDLDAPARERMAQGCMSRFGVAQALEPQALLEASDRLRRWIEQRMPGATLHREWAVAQRRPEGTILRGRADLVVESDSAFIVIDHKTFPGTRAQALERASRYGPQLFAYTSALAAHSGRTSMGSFIHLPVLGLVLPVSA